MNLESPCRCSFAEVRIDNRIPDNESVPLHRAAPSPLPRCGSNPNIATPMPLISELRHGETWEAGKTNADELISFAC